jgi:hypothetical protein
MSLSGAPPFEGVETMNTLEKLIQADALLSQWLTDNTEQDFDEQPDVDEARTLIQDAIELLEKGAAQ